MVLSQQKRISFHLYRQKWDAENPIPVIVAVKSAAFYVVVESMISLNKQKAMNLRVLVIKIKMYKKGYCLIKNKKRITYQRKHDML